MKSPLLGAVCAAILLNTPLTAFTAQPSIPGLNARVTTNESDINANSTLIDDNTNRINALKPSISVRANGTRIGTYLTTMELGDHDAEPREVIVMNDNEYIFSIGLLGSNEGNLMYPRTKFGVAVVYTTTDCTDQEYLAENHLEQIPDLGSLLKGSGYVFDNAGSIYYLPINTQPIRDQNRSYKSIRGGECVRRAYGGGELYPIFPNNPSVTGVSTSTFELPLSLGF